MPDRIKLRITPSNHIHLLVPALLTKSSLYPLEMYRNWKAGTRMAT